MSKNVQATGPSSQPFQPFRSIEGAQAEIHNRSDSSAQCGGEGVEGLEWLSALRINISPQDMTYLSFGVMRDGGARRIIIAILPTLPLDHKSPSKLSVVSESGAIPRYFTPQLFIFLKPRLLSVSAKAFDVPGSSPFARANLFQHS